MACVTHVVFSELFGRELDVKYFVGNGYLEAVWVVKETQLMRVGTKIPAHLSVYGESAR